MWTSGVEVGLWNELAQATRSSPGEPARGRAVYPVNRVNRAHDTHTHSAHEQSPAGREVTDRALQGIRMFGCLI